MKYRKIFVAQFGDNCACCNDEPHYEIWGRKGHPPPLRSAVYLFVTAWDKRIDIIWWDKQSEAELKAEIAEREAKGFRVVVASWQR